MEFLILLVVLLGILFLVKKKFPDSKVAGFIDCTICKCSKKKSAETAVNAVSTEEKAVSHEPVVVAEPSVVADVTAVASSAVETVAEVAQSVVETIVEAVQAVVEETPAVTTPTEDKSATDLGIPEDSVLRRHYLAKLEADRQAISNPYPTDSVLRRHYEHLHRG